ncbi:MAG: hypothetical protein V8R84_13170 [Eubacterium sp.]
MNQIVFSAGFVQANIFCSLLCILLPILFVWYQKRKKGVRPGAFFIGAAFCLLFSYVAATIVNVLIFSIPGFYPFSVQKIIRSTRHCSELSPLVFFQPSEHLSD